MDCRLIEICGERLAAHPMGALYWPQREALIVADLHFEKGSAFAERGVFLPPYDTRATLKRLAVLCRRFGPRLVVSLGDAFHDRGAEARLDRDHARRARQHLGVASGGGGEIRGLDDAALLDALLGGHRWLWVLGNHDPAPPKRFAGDVAAERRIGALVLRHEPTMGPSPGELAGHLHPCARIRTESGSQRRRCFAADGERMVLPAFGAYAGGLNILNEAFAPLFERPTAWALGEKGVYPISGRLLVADAQLTPAQRRRRVDPSTAIL